MQHQSGSTARSEVDAAKEPGVVNGTAAHKLLSRGMAVLC